MNESRTRQSVFEPGKADDFFEIAGLPPFDPGGTAGFSRAHALWPQVESWLRDLNEPVFLAGHSLGGALATLAAARCLADPRLPDPAELYTCGSPRVGDAAFRSSLDGLLHCRIVNDRDVVATVPPPFSLPGLPVYRHTGQLHQLGPAGWVSMEDGAVVPRASRNPAVALARFAASARRLASLIRKPGSALPQALLDHAPVNYVARLERVGTAFIEPA